MEREISFLHLGDLVSIYAKEAYANGFLKTLGHLDDRCVVHSNNGNHENPPNNFRECWLKFCPMSRYSAQRQLAAATNPGNNCADSVLLKKLKSAAKIERAQNEQNEQEMIGNVVRYGDIIQLLHRKSNKFISMRRNWAAMVEKCAFRVLLENQCDENAWFYIVPFYKYRSTGENVVLGDKVVFMSVNNAQQSLHLSRMTLSDVATCHEVNGLEISTSWKLSLVRFYEDDSQDSLKGGDVVRMFHAQREGFLTFAQDGAAIPSTVSVVSAKNKTKNISSNALWEVQVVSDNPCLGGVGLWDSLFRFKHVATGLFLCVKPQEQAQEQGCNLPGAPGNKLSLCMKMERDRDLTIFRLEATTVQNGRTIPRSERSYVKLYHPHTGSWVLSPNQEEDLVADFSGVNQVVCCMQSDNKEAFGLIYVGMSEVRDMEFSIDASKMIRSVSIKWENGIHLDEKEHMCIMQQLDEIIYYLLDDLTKLVDPLGLEGTVNPNRQKLVRDQFILRELFRLLGAPLVQHKSAPILSPTDLRANKYRNITVIFRLSYKILKLAQEGCRDNQEYIAERFFNVMQSQIGLDVFAEDTITSLVNKNYKLLARHINLPEIVRFIDLLRQTQETRFLVYLSELCVPKGRSFGSAKIQELVYFSLTDIQNIDLLIKIGLEKDQVVLSRAIGSHCMRPQFEVVQSANAGCGEDREFLSYYRYQLELFSNLCVGRTRVQWAIQAILPIEIIFRCMRDEYLPPSLRATYCKVFRIVHLNSHPQAAVAPVEYARKWHNISSHIRIAEPSLDSCTGLLHETAMHVFDFFKQKLYRKTTNAIDHNYHTCEITNLAYTFVSFGFYTFPQLLELCALMPELLDYEESLSQHRSDLRAPSNPEHILNRILNQVTFNRAGRHEIIQMIRLKILEIIQYVMDLRLDFRISNLLVNFKKFCKKASGSTDEYIHEYLRRDCKHVLEVSEKLFNGTYRTNLSLDGSKGQRLMRVLIHLANQPDYELFTASLKVLFRHFYQHEELLNAAKQLQMLVSDEDEYIYKAIKLNLEALRECVIGGTKSVKNENSVLSCSIQIFEFLGSLCRGANSKYQRRLLRNMNAHVLVLEMLQMLSLSYSENSNVVECIRHAHQFLRRFCHCDPRNQELLFGQIDILFCHMDPRIEEIKTLISIFLDNMDLCNKVGGQLIQKVVQATAKDRNVDYLQFLCNIVKMGSTYIKKNQDIVMQEILVSGDVLVFYNDTRSIQHLVNLIEENNGSEGPITNALDYHLQLIRLLLVCTAGKNAVTQIKCQSLISIESIITILSLETALVEVKEEYLRLAQFCYIDTDLDFKSQELVKTILDPLWSLVRFCTQEISKFVDVPDIPSQTRLFLCETVVSFIKKFFSSLYIETGHIFMLHTYHDLFTQLVGNLLLINRASWMSPFYHNSIRMLLQLMFDIAQNKHISLSDELKEFLTSEPSSPQLETRFTQNSMEEASQCRSVMPFNRSRHEVSSQFIELSLQELVIQLEQFYHSVIGAESAVLATIFSFPELLKMTDWMSFVEIGKDPSFTEHIIRCTNSLWERREDELVVKLLATLKRSLEPTPQLNERGICARNELMYSCVTGIGSHKELLQLFNENANVFNLVIDRIDTKFDLLAKQNRFTALEAPSLMVSLVMLSTNHTVLIEAINLGIALLQGGNCNVQKAFLYIFTQPCAEVFFAVLHEKFRRAQNELKNSYFTISNDSPPQYSSPCIPSCGVRLSKYSCQEGTDTMGSEEGTLAYSLAMKILSSDEIVIIQPLCRFLQLLCENHNTKLQHYLMFQPDHNISYNLVLDTLQLLDCMCGGTAGDLRQPGLYINLKNMGIVQQCLVSLTEYCQGPCKLAQDCIVLYESIGIDVIVSLVANEISPLCEDRLDLVLQLKNSATKALLSIMESREDSRIADQILLKMDAPVHLLDICKNAFLDEKENAFDGDVTLGLGHNLYILLYQLSSHSEELTQAFQDNRTHPALRFYAEHTEVIEIARADKSLERIVFPVPGICSNLTCATQQRVFNCTEKDQSGSRNIDFFSQLDDLYVEMDTQRDLKETHWQYWLSSHGVTWVALEFSINIIINLLVALFYPFLAADNRISTFSYIYILLIWVLSISVLLSARLIGRMNYSLKVFLTAVSFVGMTVLALYPYFGLGVLCKLLGLVLLINRGVCLNCYLALKGALTSDSAFWTERQFLYDFDFLYHGCYTLIAVLGLTVHPFFYPFLLFDVVYREETLKDIVKSVTKSSTSLLLIVLLGYIIIYLFSIVGYLFFQGDFVTETVVIHENNTATNKVEYACTSLIMCILTTLKNGFRNDGGIGDSMRTPSIEDPNYMFRIFYDMAFFFCVVILILNLILGVIIETFVNLRTEKKDRKNFLENNCFICGLDRSQFDRKKVTFQEHITKEHNPWHYLHFIILLKEKVYTEFTGPESFVALSIEKNNMCWIPISCCMSLNREESEEKFYDMADIQKLLNNTVMKLNWRSTEDMSAGHT